jgi:diadenosine hexaphosphate hydrolase (ATP-forming)
MYLCFDATTLQQTSVSLYSDPYRVSRKKIQKPPRCEMLLQAVQVVLGDQLPRGIVVATGAASFTTVRCAATIANALAFAWQVPVVGLPIGSFRNVAAVYERGIKEVDLRIQKKHPWAQMDVEYSAPPNITQPKTKPSRRTVHEHSAGGVVLHDGKVLAIRHVESKAWTFPKGHLDPGETPQKAAAREVQEETGYRVSVGKQLGTSRYQYRHADGVVIKKKVDFFLCALLSDKQQKQQVDPKENFEVRWIPISQALKKLAYQDTRRFLQLALDAST